MAKEREEWQLAGDGCWHTADKRFTILESQSGEYHHLVDNQKLRNSKTYKSFAECDEYAWQIRNGLAEPPSGKNSRRHEDEVPEHAGRHSGSRTSGKSQAARSGRNDTPEEHLPERTENEGGRGRRNPGRTERQEASQGTGRAAGKNGEQESSSRTKQKNTGQNKTQTARKAAAGNDGQTEKNPRRRRHRHKSNASGNNDGRQEQAGKNSPQDAGTQG